MVNWAKHVMAFGERMPEIPDFAVDMHTGRGEAMGRDYLYFITEASKVSPEIENRDEDLVNGIMNTLGRRGGQVTSGQPVSVPMTHGFHLHEQAVDIVATKVQRRMLKASTRSSMPTCSLCAQLDGARDDLVICDMNFPADSWRARPSIGELLRIDNVTAARATRPSSRSCRSTASSTARPSAWRSSASPTRFLPCQAEVQTEIDAAEGKSWPMGTIERFAFYEVAKKAYAVIQTGERRFYGCFIFKKGVIPPEA